jgi:hypothetical protein
MLTLNFWFVKISVAEPHIFYAAQALGDNVDAAPAPALLYSRSKCLKRIKVTGNIRSDILFPSDSL